MNPTPRTQSTAPTPADDQPASDVARRVGPPLVLGSLLLTAALLAWLALAPTAIAGPLEEAPFTVQGTLVVPPDDDGCLRLVGGDGTSREHCIDELARSDDEAYGFTDASFDDQGRLVVIDEDGSDRRLLHVDTETGQVLDTLDDTSFPDRGVEPRPVPEEAPVEVPEDGAATDRTQEAFVYTDGDRVLRSDVGAWDPDADEVVLDLQAPPGYRLDQAALSPDGDWVVLLTGTGDVAVAPTDGSAAPHVWAQVPDGRHLDLTRAIRWDG